MEEKREEIVIDGENSIMGRLASFAAKKALQGNKVVILNSDKVIMSGKSNSILGHYIEKTRIGGSSQKGPYIPRQPATMLRRAIKGMLPHKKSGGIDALKRVRCYENIPESYSNTEKIKIHSKTPGDFITLRELAKHFGK